MKKQVLIFLLIPCLLFGYGNLSGQNDHSMYYSSGSLGMLSYVSLTSAAFPEYYNYAIGTDNGNKVFVSQLGYDYPDPQPVTTRSFQIPTDANYGNFYLKGAFFDRDNNIFAYGYEETNKKGIYMVISMDGNGLPTSLRFKYMTTANTPIMDACWATHTNPNWLFYGIVMNGQFCRILNNSTTINLALPAKKINNANINTVSYDEIENVFIVSGLGNDGQIIARINNSPVLPSNVPAYNLTIPYSTSERTNTHVLSGNGYDYDGIVYLCHDVRTSTQDGIWVTHFNYLTGEVNSSNIYFLPNHKMAIVDVAHNFMNLYVMGCHIRAHGDFTKKYIAQIDLYDPSNYVAKYMDDIDLQQITTSGGIYYKIEQTYLSNISFNEVTYCVNSSGSAAGKSYMIETFDLNIDNCDSEIIIDTEAYMPQVTSYTQALVSGSGFVVNSSNTVINTYTNYGLNTLLLCGGAKSGINPEKYDQISRIIEEKKLSKQKKLEDKSNSQIGSSTYNVEVFDKQFVCTDFNGICEYKIFDIFGRIISEGITNNFDYNDIPVKHAGIYIIQVTDENYQTLNKKFIIAD